MFASKFYLLEPFTYYIQNEANQIAWKVSTYYSVFFVYLFPCRFDVIGSQKICIKIKLRFLFTTQLRNACIPENTGWLSCTDSVNLFSISNMVTVFTYILAESSHLSLLLHPEPNLNISKIALASNRLNDACKMKGLTWQAYLLFSLLG